MQRDSHGRQPDSRDTTVRDDKGGARKRELWTRLNGHVPRKRRNSQALAYNCARRVSIPTVIADVEGRVVRKRSATFYACQSQQSVGGHLLGWQPCPGRVLSTRNQDTICPGALSRQRPRGARLGGGQIDLSFISPQYLSQVRAGSIKAYAVTSEARLAVAPDIPTFGEIGLPALSFPAWFGLLRSTR